MNPVDTQEVACTPVYYKRRWVMMPLLHLPNGAVNESGRLSLYKVTPLDNQKLGELKIRDPERAWKKISASAKEQIDPRTLSNKTLKEICSRVDLPISWVTDRYIRNPRQIRKSIYRREKRKIESLSSKKFRKLRKELYKLNKKSAIIADILWWFNRLLGRAGSFVTVESLLRLRIEAVAPDEGKGLNWIDLRRIGHGACMPLPQYLWRALCKQINEDSPFVFSNKDGAPLLPAQVNRYLKRAAQQVGIKEEITSNSLRPPFRKKQAERCAKKHRVDALVKDYLELVGSKEWKQICKHIPCITTRRGRKSVHDPLVLLNAILHWQKTKCSIRKLPNWRAVHAQYRRWKASGIFDEILDFRKRKMNLNSATK